jgi:hypothetical protein
MFLLLLIAIFWLAVSSAHKNASIGQIILLMIVIYLILLVLF